MSEGGIGTIILRLFERVQGWFVYIGKLVINITITIGNTCRVRKKEKRP